MNRFRSFFKPLMWSMALLMAAFVAGCGGGGNHGGGVDPNSAVAGPTGSVCTGAACVNLGTAANYSILAKAGASTTGTTVVNGNVGVSPIARVGLTGWAETSDVTDTYSTSPYVVAPGKLYADDYVGGTTKADLGVAVLNMETAYNNAAGILGGAACPGAGEMGGLTLTAGVYACSTGLLISTNTTLSGSATDVWVFQIAQTLTQANATQVNLIGGALAKNVFWQVAEGVSIGTTAQFNGIILGKTTIAMATGSSITGRLLAQTAVTLGAATVTLP